jgi:beta-galactosidase
VTGGGCWIGAVASCNRSPSWISFARNVSTTVPPEALPGFDDSAWDVVDLPHDAIITEAYVNESGLTGQAFLPKVTSWYRKHFTVPSNWTGTYIELYVEGAFESSTWYVNGIPVLTHPSGYTSFTMRLDNVTGGLVYGGANLIAAFVDPTHYTGWVREGACLRCTSRS